MEASDEAIIARVQQGETAAFGLLFQRHYSGIKRYLLHCLPDGADADDSSVEVFVRAFRGLRRFRSKSDGSVAGYLYTVARNLVRDASRRRSAWGGLRVEKPLAETSLPDDETDLSAIEESLVRNETATRIRSALQLLATEDREILILSYQDDLSARDIMSILHKPSEAAVRAHLYRALKRLRSIVSRDGYFDEELSRRQEVKCDDKRKSSRRRRGLGSTPDVQA